MPELMRLSTMATYTNDIVWYPKRFASFINAWRVSVQLGHVDKGHCDLTNSLCVLFCQNADILRPFVPECNVSKHLSCIWSKFILNCEARQGLYCTGNATCIIDPSAYFLRLLSFLLREQLLQLVFAFSITTERVKNDRFVVTLPHYTIWAKFWAPDRHTMVYVPSLYLMPCATLHFKTPLFSQRFYDQEITCIALSNTFWIC